MDPNEFIARVLGEDYMSGNNYVARNFPRMTYTNPSYESLPTSENVIDRRVSDEEPASPQEYIDRVFEELK